MVGMAGMVEIAGTAWNCLQCQNIVKFSGNFLKWLEFLVWLKMAGNG